MIDLSRTGYGSSFAEGRPLTNRRAWLRSLSWGSWRRSRTACVRFSHRRRLISPLQPEVPPLAARSRGRIRPASVEQPLPGIRFARTRLVQHAARANARGLGSTPTSISPRAELAQRPATWMQDRVILAASRWIAYPYQHHHIPDWDSSRRTGHGTRSLTDGAPRASIAATSARFATTMPWASSSTPASASRPKSARCAGLVAAAF